MPEDKPAYAAHPTYIPVAEDLAYAVILDQNLKSNDVQCNVYENLAASWCKLIKTIRYTEDDIFSFDGLNCEVTFNDGKVFPL